MSASQSRPWSASCWRESERELLQSIIERGFGKMDKFNTNVRTMMRSCVRNSRAKTCVDLRQGTSRKLLKGQEISAGEQAPSTVEGAEKLEQDEKEKLATFFEAETPRDNLVMHWSALAVASSVKAPSSVASVSRYSRSAPTPTRLCTNRSIAISPTSRRGSRGRSSTRRGGSGARRRS